MTQRVGSKTEVFRFPQDPLNPSAMPQENSNNVSVARLKQARTGKKASDNNLR